MFRLLSTLSFLMLGTLAMAQANQSSGSKSMETLKHLKHLKDFKVIEFRRYTIKEGEREHFARYFETYFPEAFQQLGAIAFGQFFERKNRSGFTWFRGFQNLDARATVNTAFYYGPVWKEHASRMNDRLIDSDNVLLLRPLSAERGITVLPAVDPVGDEKGAEGIVVAQIFAVKPDNVDAFAKQAETTFGSYRAAGAREAGVLITLDVPNNFPALPFRTDGPYLVWLGIVKDDKMLETQINPLVEHSFNSASDTALLRGTPEFVVLDPTSRSRLRWYSEE